MGLIKRWRKGSQLLRQAKADPAIRASWMSLYYSTLTEPRRGASDPNAWRSVFKALEGGPPCRQELEWWRASCELAARMDHLRLPTLNAMVQAIDSMLPDAPDGPSDESYL